MHNNNEHSEATDRAATGVWREAVRVEIADLDRRLAENTALTHEIAASVKEIVEFFEAGRGFFTVMRAIGGVARWLAIIAAAAGLAWGIAKFGLAQLIADMKGK